MKVSSSGPISSGSSQSQYLASVSDTLCIWSFTASKDLLLSSTYRGTTNTSSNRSEQFRATCWNHTNQVVAVAGSYPRVSLGNYSKSLWRNTLSFFMYCVTLLQMLVQANNGQLLSTLQLSEDYSLGAILYGISSISL